MRPPFFRQDEANEQLTRISDPEVRLLCQAFLSKTIGSLARGSTKAESPQDLNLLVRLASDFFADRGIVEGILSGKIASLDDIDDAF